ncbi:MAG: hypothetical protein M1817_001496 [Caeruleum heppii]|nr:MAG: hypothetical protein M1817_001496 [Caeruleum heppii]
MTVSYDHPHRGSSYGAASTACLEDRFEVIKDIGDGSFGSVTSARVRTAGAHVARRGTVIAIKTMKKSFDSFAPCLELREVIFLRSLPVHAHLVPALDIFLDPTSKKLHICMEYMDLNLYQLMKARDHKCLDGPSVKSILFQIMSGLEHIHANHFFHRDIKPENIMVSCSAASDLNMSVRRYSAMATPPATPPTYNVKIADFGLARETHSKSPYTTYVSTRWYRAPEVLLRAGEYSAPVDVWAVGAMAVEVATLKPLFPGGNEVDQVWRICEVMGSPGNWYSKAGTKVGGGDWKDGVKLASKLGFSFPKMSPHSMESILQPPQWSSSLSNFVTWCLMWDPHHRPTSSQALRHEYFADAVDPLQPRASSSRATSRKPVESSHRSIRDSVETTPALHTKSSWFRKSLIGRDPTPAVTPQNNENKPLSPRPSPVLPHTTANSPIVSKARPLAEKRATWANGLSSTKAAPMPILPVLRPVSPLPNPVTAQVGAQSKDASTANDRRRTVIDEKSVKKLGRQLSVASNGNHYAEIHRQEAERALNGNGGLASPPNGQKESFFSHLRKKARRLSGRHQLPLSPDPEETEARAGCGPWSSNRSSMILDSSPPNNVISHPNGGFQDLDKILNNVRYSVDMTNSEGSKSMQSLPIDPSIAKANPASTGGNASSVTTRSRRTMQLSSHPVHRYETPDEEDELLEEVIHSTHKAVRYLDRDSQIQAENERREAMQRESMRPIYPQSTSSPALSNPYPTPSPSAKRNSIYFGQHGNVMRTPPIDIKSPPVQRKASPAKWPTPPYDDNEWAASAAASIQAAGASYR